jgi:alkylation response protein AidB-like acyl-CoA dehydrogenase
MLIHFMQPFSGISQMNFERSVEQVNFISKVDESCRGIRETEERAYLEEKLNDKLIPEFSKIGMLGCPISTRYGGLGYDILTYIMALERIGEEGSSIRTFFSAHTSIGQLVLQSWATDEQKEKYLPPTTTGKSIMGFALTEPDAGSDPSSMTSFYEDDGDHYVLSGKKHWIGNGTIADLMTTYARDKLTGKISAFIVEMNSPNIETFEMKNKMGLLTVKNAEIYFRKCKIPKENILSLPGQGLNIAYSALIDGRISVAAGSIGVMTDCLTESTNYSKLRKQHGSVLGKKQLIQDHIAKIAIVIESSKWLTYRAAYARQRLHDYVEATKLDDPNWQCKLNRTNNEYSALRAEADRLAAIAKFHASNAAFDAANLSVQIFGSYGYQKSSRVARHFLDSRATTIYEGANEVLKLKIAADILGRDFRSY